MNFYRLMGAVVFMYFVYIALQKYAVHYKSQPDAKAQRETQKSSNVKSLTKIE